MEYDYDYTADLPTIESIDSEELFYKRFKRVDFIVSSLLKPGLAILAGSPKIGKSWMVLDLCLSVAKGEPFLGLDTKECGVLYIALEDSHARIQERMVHMTDSCSPNLRVATTCAPLGEQLMKEISSYCGAFPLVKLIVIDTFQKIRAQGMEMSYANDYREVSYLKAMADELGICILLVHHTRKQSDSDRFNEISGTNGIAGSADTLMVLKKDKRTEKKAVLTCTGRDIEDRELELKFNRETCLWEVIKSSEVSDEEKLPQDISQVIAYVKTLGDGYMGTNTEFCERFNEFSGLSLSPRAFKQRINRYRYMMEDYGVFHDSYRESDGSRCFMILYKQSHDKSIPETEGG